MLICLHSFQPAEPLFTQHMITRPTTSPAYKTSSSKSRNTGHYKHGGCYLNNFLTKNHSRNFHSQLSWKKWWKHQNVVSYIQYIRNGSGKNLLSYSGTTCKKKSCLVFKNMSKWWKKDLKCGWMVKMNHLMPNLCITICQ